MLSLAKSCSLLKTRCNARNRLQYPLLGIICGLVLLYFSLEYGKSHFNGEFSLLRPTDQLSATVTVTSFLRVHDFEDELPVENISCIPLKQSADIRAKICLNPLSDFISVIIHNNGAWGTGLHAQILQLMALHADIGFVDIGANLGVHALSVAAHGYDVVAVEPLPENILRFHKSTIISNLTDRITLLDNAIYDSRRCVSLTSDWPSNKGTFRVWKGTKCSPNAVRTILLEDLLHVTPFRKAVLKIDTEGTEPFILHKPELFFQNIEVVAIFMEIKHFIKHAKSRDVAYKMIRFLRDSGFTLYEINSDCVLDLEDWSRWHSEDAVWIHEDTANRYFSQQKSVHKVVFDKPTFRSCTRP